MGKAKRFLIILSSPRPGSNSSAMALDAAIKEASRLRLKPSVEIVDVNRASIAPCAGCLRCAKNFSCVIKDDATKISGLIKKADSVFVSAPVYFTGVPSTLKALVDRSQPEWFRSKAAAKKVTKNKEGYIILTAGDGTPRDFSSAETELRSFFAVNRIKPVRVIKRGKMDAEGEAAARAAGAEK